MFALPNESLHDYQKRELFMEELLDSNLNQSCNIKEKLTILSKKPLILSFSSKKNLFISQAACTWIYTLKKNYTLAIIQQRPKLFKYLNKDEILEHEKIHAIRKDLNSNKYEEIIAYQTSKNPIRRFLGPLISTNLEQILTICSCICAPFSHSLTLLYPFFLLTKLIQRQARLKKCKQQIKNLSLKKQILNYLTDQEIHSFSKYHSFCKPLTLRSFQLLRCFSIDKS